MPNRQQSHREGAGHDTPDLQIWPQTPPQRQYVQDRLAGLITRSNGVWIKGLQVPGHRATARYLASNCAVSGQWDRDLIIDLNCFAIDTPVAPWMLPRLAPMPSHDGAVWQKNGPARDE
jgi:hypothetical protein